MDVYEERGAFGPSFQEKAIRKAFVVKVYSLLMIQLGITIVIMSLCLFITDIKEFILDNYLAFLITTGVLSIVLEITLSCCRSVRTAVPLNYILLTIMTVSFSFFISTFSAIFETWIVFTAFGITTGSVLLLTLIASLPCFDVTGWGIYLCMASLVLSLVGTILMIVGLYFRMRVLFIVYAGIAALLLCLWIIFDTQLILGGRKYQLSSDEYILGVVMLYTDIINFYLIILSLLGLSNN